MAGATVAAGAAVGTAVAWAGAAVVACGASVAASCGADVAVGAGSVAEDPQATSNAKAKMAAIGSSNPNRLCNKETII